jgi:spermidine/putrescine transport system ATP-binding protein
MTAAGGRLEVVHVTKRYGDTPVLRDVSLTVENGEFMTILGPSGSGKTTILRLIGGFTDLAEGQILFGGVDVSPVPIHRRPFNTVFQDYALFPHMTVGQNVGYGLLVRGVAKRAIRGRVKEALGVVTLDGFAERYPSQLSGGQRQRVALARALICEPKLILLDEPLGALDAELRRQMQAFLKNLQRQVRITFLFVTHDQEEAIAMSDRICVMNHGALEQIGPPDEVYYRPRSHFVATFFGDNNLLPGAIRSDAAVDTPLGALRCADPGLAELAPGSPVTIAVRPEALRLELAVSAPASANENRLPVAVRSIDFVGPTSRIQVAHDAAPERPLLVKVPSRMGGLSIRAGDRVDLVWAAADCVAIAGAGASP